MNGFSTLTGLPMMAGPPSSEENEAAIRWSIRLSSNRVTEADVFAFRAWLALSPDNERAWQRLKAAMTPFDIAARRQARPEGLAELAMNYGRSRRRFLRTVSGMGVAGVVSASIANRFVPLGDLMAGHVTRTGQLTRVALADGASIVLGPRTGLNLDRDGAIHTITLLEGEVFLAAFGEPLALRMQGMELSAARGSFVARCRYGVSSVAAVDAPGEVFCNGATLALAAGRSVAFDGSNTSFRTTTAANETGWVDGKLYADSDRLADVVDRLRPYFAGIIRLAPGLASLPLTGVLPLDDLDLAFAALAQAMDVSVRHFTPFWISIESTQRRP